MLADFTYAQWSTRVGDKSLLYGITLRISNLFNTLSRYPFSSDLFIILRIFFHIHNRSAASERRALHIKTRYPFSWRDDAVFDLLIRPVVLVAIGWAPDSIDLCSMNVSVLCRNNLKTPS